ncbi:MAG: hypothetical protein OEX17_04675 [Rhodospirillaceae bacterium]|nr:hypothetical protein [Rhodospirillaceae bacterium]
MIHTILDPGNIYVVGFALMFGFAAAVLYAAKRTQERNGEETTISMRPINVCLALAATMSAAMLAKASIFANFYDTYSIYAPGA